MVESLVAKLIAAGADLSSRNAVRLALRILGEDEGLADVIYLMVKTRSYRKAWESCGVDKRAVFLPQCLRNSKECKAELTERGYICKRCGKCPVFEIIEFATSLGYKHVYIVPGGSMVYRILKEIDVHAALGVACVVELCEASERLSAKGLPHQCVPLLRAGCIDTAVDVEKVKQVLKMGLDEEGAGDNS